MRPHRTLHPSSGQLDAFLRATPDVQCDHVDIRRHALAITQGHPDPIERTARLFEWVRDQIPHTFDVGAEIVTCSAIEVLGARTGICHAKAHLLAALLRASGIPAGFVYQRLRWDETSDGWVLHGLNGVHLGPLDRWILLDARGNTRGIDAQFDTEAERLAFPDDAGLGGRIYPTVFSDPAPTVIAALRCARDTNHLRTLLPDSLER